MFGAILYSARDSRVAHNLASHNAQDGIWVQGDSYGLVLRRNTANGNGDLGIEAPTSVIDGGGNRAAGNGDPRQC